MISILSANNNYNRFLQKWLILFGCVRVALGMSMKYSYLLLKITWISIANPCFIVNCPSKWRACVLIKFLIHTLQFNCLRAEKNATKSLWKRSLISKPAIKKETKKTIAYKNCPKKASGFVITQNKWRSFVVVLLCQASLLIRDYISLFCITVFTHEVPHRRKVNLPSILFLLVSFQTSMTCQSIVWFHWRWRVFDTR